MLEPKVNWAFAAARIPAMGANVNAVLKLHDSASACYYIPGIGVAAPDDMNGMNLWMSRQKLDTDAISIVLGEILYERLFHGGSEGLRRCLETMQKLNRRTTFARGSVENLDELELLIFELEDVVESEFSFLFNCLPRDIGAAMPKVFGAIELFNFIPTYDVKGTDEEGDAIVLRGCSAAGTGLNETKYIKNSRKVLVRFADESRKLPIKFNYQYDLKVHQEQFLSACEDAFRLFGQRPAFWDLIDRPLDGDMDQPLNPPDGAWHILGGLVYKPGFDPLVRRPGLTEAVRYPLFQLASDEAELLWQVDIVHTLSESFFDIQTSQGEAYLRNLLKQHELPIEIWKGDFADRWCDYSPGRSDEEKVISVVQTTWNPASANDKTKRLSDSDQFRLIAENYAELCKERFALELDFSGESVGRLDQYITEHFPEGVTFDTTIVSVAAYLGETVRHQVGGVWIEHEKMGPCIEFRGLLVNVFAWTRKRFENGAADSLVSKLAALQKIAAERSDGV